jgi:hypothetical protein
VVRLSSSPSCEDALRRGLLQIVKIRCRRWGTGPR